MRKEQLEEAASKGLTAVEDMQCGDQFLYGQLKLFRVIKFEKDHFVAHCKSNGSVETFGLDMAVRKSGSVGLSQLEGYFLQNGEVFCYEGEWYIVKEEFPAADGGMRVSKIGTRNEGYFDDNLVVEVYDSWAIR